MLLSSSDLTSVPQVIRRNETSSIILNLDPMCTKVAYREVSNSCLFDLASIAGMDYDVMHSHHFVLPLVAVPFVSLLCLNLATSF